MKTQLQTWEQSAIRLSLEKSNFLFIDTIVKDLVANEIVGVRTLTEFSPREVRDRLFDIFIEDVRAAWTDGRVAEIADRMVYGNE